MLGTEIKIFRSEMFIARAVRRSLDGCTNLPHMRNRYKTSQNFGAVNTNALIQQYKEGKTILERALICEKEGFLDDQLNTSLTRSNSLNSRTRFLQSTDEE